jgi:putative ATPase
MDELGYGQGYVSAHEIEGGVSGEEFLPAPLAGRAWYLPRPIGFEREIIKRLEWWEDLRKKAREGKP